jgi:PKD repeat protein
MKIEKILIALIIVSSLFLISTTAVGISEERTVIDDQDDVFDSLANDTTSKYPNIDIVKLEYTRDGTQVTVAMTVKGVIEDLGSMGEQEFGDTIIYAIYLDTSYDSYEIAYANKQCIITYGDTFENLTDYSVDGPELKIHFELNNTDETYQLITAENGYIQVDIITEEYNYLVDYASDQPLEITAEIPEVDSTGKTVQFKVFPDYGQPPYEYIWNFGDGATSTEKNPTHTYTKAGSYNCTVIVTDQSDTSESYSGTITIINEGGGESGTPIITLFAIIVIIAVIGAVIIIWIIRR